MKSSRCVTADGVERERLERCRVLLPALWAGALLCIAALAAPAIFAVLPAAQAGRVVGRLFEQEAYASLALGCVVLLLERHRRSGLARRGQAPGPSVDMLLSLGTIFCTVAGYFAVQPLMAVARAGQPGLSFGELHAISVGFFALKFAAVLALAWRAGAR